jgi:hypothetical protein
MTNKIMTIYAYTKYILYYMLTLYNNIVNIMIIGITPDFTNNNIYDTDTDSDIDIDTKNNITTEIESDIESDIEIKNGNINFESIKQLLKNHAIQLLSFNPNKDDLIVLKRIYHIFNILFKNYKINKEEEIIELNNIINSMLYSPSWDTEDIIFIYLDNLCNFLSIHYSYDENIEKVIREDIKHITIFEEIDKILAL